MPSGGGQGGGGQGGGGQGGGMPSGGGQSGGGQSGGGQSGGCNCGCNSSSQTTSFSAVAGFMIENAPGVADHSISPASEYSPAGVRYFDGQINVTSTDLSTDGFGSFWNQVRSWSNGTPPSSNNGTGVIDMDRPYLLRPNGDNSQIVVASSATEARFFNLVGSNYVPTFYVQDQLTHNTSTGEFLLTDTSGDVIHFWDWTASQSARWGQFKSCTDPEGNTISVTSYTSNGNVAEMQRSDGTTTQSYLFT
jgi:hypothetical protein